MTSPTEKRICLGKIASVHGVKGLVKIVAYGDDPYLIETIKPVFTTETGSEAISITLKNMAGKYILAQADGCDTREKAEALRGTEFWVNRSDLPEIDDENSFYIEDLIGLTILNTDNIEIGKVLAVPNFGAGDLIEIKPKAGMSYFVPFQHSAVQEIDIENQTIIIENPEQFLIV